MFNLWWSIFTFPVKWSERCLISFILVKYKCLIQNNACRCFTHIWSKNYTALWDTNFSNTVRLMFMPCCAFLTTSSRPSRSSNSWQHLKRGILFQHPAEKTADTAATPAAQPSATEYYTSRIWYNTSRSGSAATARRNRLVARNVLRSATTTLFTFNNVSVAIISGLQGFLD